MAPCTFGEREGPLVGAVRLVVELPGGALRTIEECLGRIIAAQVETPALARLQPEALALETRYGARRSSWFRGVRHRLRGSNGYREYHPFGAPCRAPVDSVEIVENRASLKLV
jgi:hypothetical protein